MYRLDAIHLHNVKHFDLKSIIIIMSFYCGLVVSDKIITSLLLCSIINLKICSRSNKEQ